jgi:hypothetical protein
MTETESVQLRPTVSVGEAALMGVLDYLDRSRQAGPGRVPHHRAVTVQQWRTRRPTELYRRSDHGCWEAIRRSQLIG